MANNILKEAIADAKAVREVALANAKAALEEAFTPRLQSMLSAKLSETLNEEEDEEVDLDEMMDMDDEDTLDEMDMYDEDNEEANLDEDIDLEEILSELELDEDDSEDMMEEEELDEDNLNENFNLDVLLEEINNIEEDDMDMDDMDMDENRKWLNKLGMGHPHPHGKNVHPRYLEEDDMDMDDDDMDMNAMTMDMDEMHMDDMDIDLDEIDMYEGPITKGLPFPGPGPTYPENPFDTGKKIGPTTKGLPGPYYPEIPNPFDTGKKIKPPPYFGGTEPTNPNELNEGPEIFQAMAGIAGLFGAAGITTALEMAAKDPEFKEKHPKAADALQKLFGFMQKMGSALGSGIKEYDLNQEVTNMAYEELRESRKALEIVKSELNEVNLLNSKLLYVNRIFKANNLSELQKLRVVETLDNATNVKEAKLIYETIKDTFNVVKTTQTNSTKPIRESFGMASKAAGLSTAPKSPILNESNDMVARMQKLANIKII
jgi:hypothetical protein